MSLQERKLKNQIRLFKIVNKDLKEQSEAIYEDLSKTRQEIGQLLDERTEEMQTEFFNILGNIKLLLASGQYRKLIKYVDAEYEILQEDLFLEMHEDKKSMLPVAKH